MHNTLHIKIACLYIFVLNFVDALLTHYSVGNGIAKELNPLMDYLLQIGPAYFYAIKLTLVSLGLILLLRLGYSRGTALALAACSIIYTAIIFLHISIIF